MSVPAAGRPPVSAAGLAALGALCAAIAFAVYAPALRGPFVSDDFGYLAANPYTESLSPENLAAILDPRGAAARHTGNYAPVHLLLTALERKLFGDAPLGYHAVNVALHAGNALLLALLLARAGALPALALGGALFFLLHPANVEAVAWVSQLKSVAGLAFALGAWLALERWPALATALFALAIATKAHALFVLPGAAGWLWLRAPRGATAWRWLAAWLALGVAFAPAQLAAFAHLGAVEAEADLGLRLRGMFAGALHYLVMAATSLGVSAYHEPAPVASWLAPRWLGGLLACAALGARALWALRARRVEGVFWVAAAAGFAPVSQLFPFLSPIGDRYLYFMLPGLIGAAACAVSDRWREWHAAGLAPRRRTLRGAGGLVACALLVLLAAHAAERARLWRGEVWLLRDAARHYPEGGSAHFLRARAAAQRSEPDTALDHLRRAAEHGFDRYDALAADPGLAPLYREPAFGALLDALAARFVERLEARGARTQPELYALGRALLFRGERESGLAALASALAAAGPWDARIRAELALAAEAARAPGVGSPEEPQGRRADQRLGGGAARPEGAETTTENDGLTYEGARD